VIPYSAIKGCTGLLERGPETQRSPGKYSFGWAADSPGFAGGYCGHTSLEEKCAQGPQIMEVILHGFYRSAHVPVGLP